MEAFVFRFSKALLITFGNYHHERSLVFLCVLDYKLQELLNISHTFLTCLLFILCFQYLNIILCHWFFLLLKWLFLSPPMLAIKNNEQDLSVKDQKGLFK